MLFREAGGGARVSGLDRAGIVSCRTGAFREAGFDRRDMFAASNALQSRSVFGSRLESPGVSGDGDVGRDPDTELCLDTIGEVVTLSRENSELNLGGVASWRRPVSLREGETAREEPWLVSRDCGSAKSALCFGVEGDEYKAAESRSLNALVDARGVGR